MPDENGNQMKTEMAGPGDVDAIVGLFNLVFKHKRDIDAWKSLYAPTPAGLPVSCIIRSDGGEIIGHLGAIPAWYLKGPDRLKGALLVDIMVHPEWTRRGLATRLSLAMHEILGDGFDLSIGFSNRQAVHTHTKTGMSYLGKAPIYLRQPRFSAQRASKTRGNGPEGLQGAAPLGEDPAARGTEGERGSLRIRPISLQDPDLVLQMEEDGMPLWHRSRDLSVLRWRYTGKPQGHYDFFVLDAAVDGAGYMVLAHREIMGLDAGLIVDFWPGKNGRETRLFLLSQAVELLSRQGVRVIACLMEGNQAVRSALRRLGFLRLPQSVFPAQLNIVFKAYSDVARSIPEDRKGWYLTWGDTDLV
jgi:GNAT superfamily N-acetyltransferase